MRSAALVQLVNSALETLRRKEMAPLWHRLAKKNNSHIEKTRAVSQLRRRAREKGLGGSAARHRSGGKDK